MRVAITGAGGFIGTALCSALDRHGDLRVSAYDRPDFDIREQVDPARFGGVDVVFHLAALTPVAPSLRDPDGYFATNAGGTRNALDAATRAGVRRFVLASSSSVYGECPEPAFEGRERRPLSPYASSKCDAEDIVDGGPAWMERIVARPFTVYGPGKRDDMLCARLLRGERMSV